MKGRLTPKFAEKEPRLNFACSNPREKRSFTTYKKQNTETDFRLRRKNPVFMHGVNLPWVSLRNNKNHVML